MSKTIDEGSTSPSSLYFDYPSYELRPAPELAGSVDCHDVVIVGAGPVGMACALLLARRGIRVALLEAGATVGYGSRAGSISRHSLQILKRAGVLERLLAVGLAYEGGWTYYRDQKVFEFSMDDDLHTRYPPMLKLQQCYVEAALADALEAHPLVDVRWASTATSIEQTSDVVRVGVSSTHGDYTLRARFVIASDGAKSTVRRLFGLGLGGVTYPATFVVADIRFQSSAAVGRRVWFDPPSNPNGSVIMHRQPRDIWRFDYQVNEGDDDEQVNEDAVRKRVEEHLSWIGETAPWELDWLTVYRAHSRRLDSFRHGRVLYAGDAAHLVPIFGVRGLNSGLADADNLAWKLARVIEDAAPPTLLDTYDRERRHATDENIREADKSTRFMCPRGPGARALRDAVLRLAIDEPFVRPLLDPRQSKPVAYPADGAVPGAEEQGRGLVGSVLPDRRLTLREGTVAFLHDFLGDEFTAIRLTEHGDEVQCVDRRVGDEDVREIVVPTSAASDGQLDQLVGCTLLVRPDTHIAYCGPTGDEPEMARALACVAGRANEDAGCDGRS